MSHWSEALSKVDPAVVAELRAVSARGSSDLYGRLVELFRASSVDALQHLRTSLQGSAFQSARAVCHRLKSSAANVGALEFSRHVGQLERACLEGDLARGRDLLQQLQAAHLPLLAALAEACEGLLTPASTARAARR